MVFWKWYLPLEIGIKDFRMTGRLTLDNAGRLVLPKPVRDELQLGPGDRLALEVKRGNIVLKPLRSSTALQKERGIWVYRTGTPLSSAVVAETLEAVRTERERRTLNQR